MPCTLRVATRILLCLSLLAAAAVNASAATWYVSTSGNDAGAGSITAPFQTITHAASKVAPGDTIYVRAGVYYELVRIASVKGTPAARITIASYPGETAIIDGTGSPLDTNLVEFLPGSEYIDISGFEVRNATRIGILVWGAKNIGIYDNLVHRSFRNGIYTSYSSPGVVTDIEIDGNSVTNNVLENESRTWTGGWAQAIGIAKSERVRVTNNNVYRNYGEGIDFILSDYGYAAFNEIWDNYSVLMYLDNAQFTTIERNLIYTTGDTQYYRGGYPAHGIGTANERYSQISNPLSDLTIVNNIVLNTRWAFYYSDYENGGGLKNSVIANNTFYNATHAMLAIYDDAHDNTIFQNNIFYEPDGAPMTYTKAGRKTSGSGSGIIYRNNNWYGGSAGFASGSGDVIGDPMLESAGGLSPESYRLSLSSPLLARAHPAPTILAVDYWGSPRVGWDIGAHELSSGSIGSLDEEAPTPPTALTATAVGSSRIDLSWAASTDNVGVTGYKIYRDGQHVATVGGTSHSDQGLSAATSYTYRVSALDGAANESTQSEAASATTAALAQGAIHVKNVAIQYQKKGKWHHYSPVVTIVDGSGSPVSGVTVTGAWTGALSGTLDASTGTDGVANFSSSRTSSTASVTFTVTNLVHGSFAYDASANEETSATTSLGSVD
ncbi:MAG TPA: right-handed parallel beta-helix repeat-containing protein [Thermoanaerobaculia bacterium]|nr:right-handed parallel beta-helix repeat-containing protein [Thermoanaerobaculia bacterium]